MTLSPLVSRLQQDPREFDHQLRAASRIRNARLKVASIKHRVRQLAFQREEELEAQQVPWLEPGHWSRHLALGVAAVFIACEFTALVVLLLSTFGGH